jgi:hypothetical protein
MPKQKQDTKESTAIKTKICHIPPNEMDDKSYKLKTTIIKVCRSQKRKYGSKDE